MHCFLVSVPFLTVIVQNVFSNGSARYFFIIEFKY